MINQFAKMFFLIYAWVMNKITELSLGTQLMIAKMRDIHWGLCKAPTGYGKSSQIFWNLAERIKYAIDHEQKLVVTLSTPLLVLNDQFYQDLIDFLAGINVGINGSNCVFVDNSSVEKNQRGIVAGLNVDRWGVADMVAAIKNNFLPQIVICISTHKSYNKFLSVKDGFILKQVKDAGYTVATYFDECHTIVDGSNNGKNTNDPTEKDSDPIYMDQLKQVADYLYFFSATPALWQATWFVQNYANAPFGYNGFVHEISILAALKEKQILPPEVTMCEVDNNKDITTLVDALEAILKKEYRYGHRKVLVTCMHTGELEQLRDELVNNRGLAIALTCAQHGKHIIVGGTDTVYNSITEFSKAIETYNGDMIILHIRQMIAGVDVPAITSVVNRVFDNTPQNVVKMIQTNGRALRVRRCDRRYFANKQEWMATKICGEVFNIIDKEDFKETAMFLGRFFNLVYNTDKVKVFRLVKKGLSIMPKGSELNVNGKVIGTSTGVCSEATWYLFKFLQKFCDDHKNDIKLASQNPEFQSDFIEDATDYVNSQAQMTLDEINKQTIASLEAATFMNQQAIAQVNWTAQELADMGIFR